MRKGNENEGGTLYSIRNHYGTTRGVFTVEDLIRIPEVIKNGTVTPKIRRNTPLVEYKYTDENGTVLTVLTEKRTGREEFADF